MDKIEAIKILKDFHDESAIFSVRTALETLHPELKESEDETIRKELIKYFSEGREYLSLIPYNKEQCVAWLEKQGGKDKLIQELGEYKVKYTQEVLEKHINSMSNKDDERLRKTTIAFLKDFAEQGYENAVECIDWLEKQGQPRMQNGIIINGVEYELIKDDEADECERCALSDICHDARKEVICNPIFGDLSISHRFEKRNYNNYNNFCQYD